MNIHLLSTYNKSPTQRLIDNDPVPESIYRQYRWAFLRQLAVVLACVLAMCVVASIIGCHQVAHAQEPFVRTDGVIHKLSVPGCMPCVQFDQDPTFRGAGVQSHNFTSEHQQALRRSFRTVSDAEFNQIVKQQAQNGDRTFDVIPETQFMFPMFIGEHGKEYWLGYDAREAGQLRAWMETQKVKVIVETPQVPSDMVEFRSPQKLPAPIVGNTYPDGAPRGLFSHPRPVTPQYALPGQPTFAAPATPSNTEGAEAIERLRRQGMIIQSDPPLDLEGVGFVLCVGSLFGDSAVSLRRGVINFASEELKTAAITQKAWGRLVAEINQPTLHAKLKNVTGKLDEKAVMYVLVPESKSGFAVDFLKGIALKMLESNVLVKLEELPVPIHVFFERTNGGVYQAIKNAVDSTPEEAPPADKADNADESIDPDSLAGGAAQVTGGGALGYALFSRRRRKSIHEEIQS